MDPRRPLDVAREIIYSPLESENLAERATRRLAEAIGLGLLEVGERLPPENELAQLFGIAPMTVRESLSELRRAGYLETRRGRGGGTFVIRATPQPPDRRRGDFIKSVSVDELRDLTEVRVAVSGAAAALAAERARDDELAELRELVERMATESRYDRFRLLDGRFHVTLTSASRSRRLTELETSLQAELTRILLGAPHSGDVLGITNGQHRAVVSAVEQRDPDEARNQMEEHLRSSGEFLVLARLAREEKR